MKKLFAFIFLVGGWTSMAIGQVNVQIDHYLSDVSRSHAMPGFSVVLVNKDKVLYTNAFGLKSLDSHEPYTVETVSSIGSLTKSITALAVLQLVDAGQLSLDNRVKEYIPEFTSANPERSDIITVRMLLNNTSGLSGNVRNSYDMTEGSIRTMLAGISNLFISKIPGTSYEYSNIGFSIAGLLISKISGMSYSAYVKEKIFIPLGMTHSSVLPIQANSQGAKGHFPGVLKPIVSNQTTLLSGEFVPAGKFAESTVRDLGSYLRMYLNHGSFQGKKLISENLVQKMWEPEIEFIGLPEKDGGNSEKSFYGLGWMISRIDGRKIIHHAGSTGTTSSFTMIDPENELAVSMVTNLDLTLTDRYRYAFGLNIVNNILHLAKGNPTTDFAIPRDPDPTLNEYHISKELVKKYTGTFQHRRGGDNFVYYDKPEMAITNHGDTLFASISRKDQTINHFILDFINPTLAVSRNIASPSFIRFKADKNGKINGAYCFGMQYKKVQNQAFIQLQNCYFGPVKCAYPQRWIKTLTKKGFILSNLNSPSSHIECTLSELPINSQIPGSQKVERLNQITWQKQSFYLREGPSDKLVSTFSTQLEDQYLTISFVSNPQEHSYYLKKECTSFLEKITLNVNPGVGND